MSSVAVREKALVSFVCVCVCVCVSVCVRRVYVRAIAQ